MNRKNKAKRCKPYQLKAITTKLVSILKRDKIKDPRKNQDPTKSHPRHDITTTSFQQEKFKRKGRLVPFRLVPVVLDRTEDGSVVLEGVDKPVLVHEFAIVEGG